MRQEPAARAAPGPEGVTADHGLGSPHALGVAETARQLGSDRRKGLGQAHVRLRLATYGKNRLRRAPPKHPLAILAHQFKSVIVWLLAAAAVTSFVWRDMAEGIAILVVLVINGAIGFFTELRAARSMEKLLRIADVQARVRRDGIEQWIDAEDLVPGDLVILEAGDIVAADLRLSQVSSLEADESALTGEALPVEKSVSPVAVEAVLGDRHCMAFQGTAITKGAGEGLVVATGMTTELGRISDLAQGAESEVAPLERRLDRLGRRLVYLTLGLSAITIAIGLLRGHELGDMIQTGVALAVAAVPEGLPVVATLSLARGMWRMSARNAVIRRLSSVETLGATTVILTDKTGTLTENRMTVERFVFGGHSVDAAAGMPLDDTRLSWALRIGVLCNTADIGDGSEKAGAGDPMELALIEAAHAAGLDQKALQVQYRDIRKQAFDPVRKMMATVHRDGDNCLFAVKGAVEAVLAVATHEIGPDGRVTPLDDGGRQDWRDRNAKAAQEGLRLLALAMKHAPSPQADPYRDLVLVGLVAFSDPIRRDVPAAVRASRAAGVRVVMVTGDHAATARTIARAAGLGDGDLEVVDGSELAGLTPETVDTAMQERILRADVFARLDPAAKLTLVAVHQRAGHVVAMTGDGVNDAPALKKADIGIAMGQRGTEVAKEAAHMILRDDAFSTIIEAMRQGRVIFRNIRQFVVYLISCNVSEVLIVGLAVGAGLPTPLLPLHILYLNLVTDVFPAFALGLGGGDATVMAHPPRDPKEPIVDRASWNRIAFLGGTITLSVLATYMLALTSLDLGSGPAITVAFLTLALAQVWNVLNVRDPASGLFRNEVTQSPYVWAAVALCLGLTGLAIWHPFMSGLLRLEPPGQTGLALAVAGSFVPLVLGQIWLALQPGDARPEAEPDQRRAD